MSDSPAVTVLFTDIEGSATLREKNPEAMRIALVRHDEILREGIEEHNGYVFKTMGDAFCAASLVNESAWETAWEEGLAMKREAGVSCSLESTEERG